jgi:hypothetical protein
MSNITVNSISPRTTPGVDFTGIDQPSFQGSPLALEADTVMKSGSTMTGPLVLPGDATLSLHAVPLQQVTTLLSAIPTFTSGTFTPGMAVNGSSVGITYSSQDGRYLKIGTWVIGDVYVVLSNKGSGSGQVTITGLPFVTNGVFAFRSSVDNFSITHDVVAFSALGQTTLTLRQFNGTSGDNVYLTDTNITNTSLIHINFSYTTTV